MTDPRTPPDEPGRGSARAFAARTAERIKRGQASAEAQLSALEARRPRSPAVDITFSVVERNRDIFAGTLAGALAFRLFLFLLPFTLVIVVLLSFLISSDPGSSQDLVDRFGLRGALADALVQGVNQGRASRWWALGVGLFGTAWAAIGALRTVRLVHFVAWDQQPEPLRGFPRAVGAFVATNVVLIGVPMIAAWGRAVLGIFGSLIGFIGVFVGFVALWVAISARLPHRNTPWQFLVPGAVIIAIGTYCLQLVTVLFFAPRLESSASVYGAVGVAAVILTWLFIVARLIVGSAVVNAVLYERRIARRRPLPQGSATDG